MAHNSSAEQEADSGTLIVNQQFQPEEEHPTAAQFASIPPHGDHASQRIYETSRHWKVGLCPPSAAPFVLFTYCCHCGQMRRFGSLDSYSKSFGKLAEHFTTGGPNGCNNRPRRLKTKLMRLAKESGNGNGKRSLMAGELCGTIWESLHDRQSKRARLAPDLEDATTAVAEKVTADKPSTIATVSGEKIPNCAEEKVTTDKPSEEEIVNVAKETNITTTTATGAVASVEEIPKSAEDKPPRNTTAHGEKIAAETNTTTTTTITTLDPITAGPDDLALQDKNLPLRLGGKPALQEECHRQGLATHRSRTWLTEISPHPTYVEETAFLYHDPYEDVPPDLPPLPPPMEIDLGEFADNVSFSWTLDKNARVVTCNFSGQSGFQTKEDEVFWGTLLESNDMTVVSNGLLDTGRDRNMLWDFRVIRGLVGDQYHHKFQRFVKKENDSTSTTQYEEADELVEGLLGEYIDYITSHNMFKNETATSFVGTESRTCVPVNTAAETLSLIDLELPRVLPRHYDDFRNRWKLPQVLPGGPWCMTNYLPASARPFMGPNAYITPGGAYTQFHQAGNGTLDSGHYVCKGYNEVVMLRRLPERHKQAATEALLQGNEQNSYDALYGLPHGPGQKPRWPTKDTIAFWRAMGYCPSVFVLGPGQHVHINKGRLHAFRKVANEMLPENDCHYELRKQLIENQGWKTSEKAPLCVSIAWNWQFVGNSPEVVNRESTSALECQLLVDKRIDMSCLAIPRACLLALGKSCLPMIRRDLPHMFDPPPKHGEDKQHNDGDAVQETLLRGLAPSLLFVLDENIKLIRASLGNSHSTRGTLQLAPKIDTALNPLISTIDPNGKDYFCKLCQKELENTYLHCNGCEDLLERDFNICMECFESERWATVIEMAHGRPASRATVCPTSCTSHTGSFVARTSCQCQQSCPCHSCGNCHACNCTCHSVFTVRRRYFDLDRLLAMKEKIMSDTNREPLEYGELTNTRLALAVDREGRGREELDQLLCTHPQLCPRNFAAVSEGDSRYWPQGVHV